MRLQLLLALLALAALAAIAAGTKVDSSTSIGRHARLEALRSKTKEELIHLRYPNGVYWKRDLDTSVATVGKLKAYMTSKGMRNPKIWLAKEKDTVSIQDAVANKMAAVAEVPDGESITKIDSNENVYVSDDTYPLDPTSDVFQTVLKKDKKIWAPNEFPSPQAEEAFTLGFFLNVGPTIDGWLAEDILSPFNPWRALEIDRTTDKDLTVATLSATHAKIRDRPGADRLAALKTSFEEYVAGRQTNDVNAKRNLAIFADPEDDRYTPPPDCAWQIKAAEAKQAQKAWNMLSNSWDFPAEPPTPATTCDPDVRGKGTLKDQPLIWYYLGAIAGWLSSNPRVLSHVSQFPVMVDFNVAVGVPVNSMARPTFWHIDGSYLSVGNKVVGDAPMYFISTNHFPTYFMRGKVENLLSDAQKGRMENDYGCARGANPGADCRGAKFLADLFGGGAGQMYGGYINTHATAITTSANKRDGDELCNSVRVGAAGSEYRTGGAKRSGPCPAGVTIQRALNLDGDNSGALAFMGPYQPHLSAWNNGGGPVDRYFLRFVVNADSQRLPQAMFLEESETIEDPKQSPKKQQSAKSQQSSKKSQQTSKKSQHSARKSSLKQKFKAALPTMAEGELEKAQASNPFYMFHMD